jgi:hypothetical protein
LIDSMITQHGVADGDPSVGGAMKNEAKMAGK